MAMDKKFILCCLALSLVAQLAIAQTGTPGTMGIYNPSSYNPKTFSACPNSGWNPSVSIPDGQAVFAGRSSECGATYDLTSDYNRGFGVKAVVKIVATCSSGCYNFLVSNPTFQSIAQRGAQVPLSITYIKK